MNRRFLVSLTLTLALAVALPGAALAKTYGKGVTLKESTRISELIAGADTYVGKAVRVEGTITDVCSKRGCWMEIASDKEFQTLRFKVEDGVIVIPVEARGKKAVAEGVFTKTELSQEQAEEHAKHMAEEQGRKYDPSRVSRTVYQLKGSGAVID
jgi:hypothetical protein